MIDGMPRRRRLGWKKELLLALMPTLIVLAVMTLVEALSRQRLLFASLASSAFLIYLDPGHTMNMVRALLISQLGAAVIGMLSFVALGPGYLSGGVAMVIVIIAMILLDAMHPPAIATALSFSLRAGNESNLKLFILALGITVILVLLQRMTLRIVRGAG